MRTEIITKEIFTFDELSDKAKEKAREWFKSGTELETDYRYDYFESVARAIGIEFDQRSVALIHGDTRNSPKIWWTGFCSQGDGASFEGGYSYSRGWKAELAKVSNDEMVIEIAEGLQALQKPYFYRLSAYVSHQGRSYHSMAMGIHLDDDCFAYDSDKFVGVADQLLELMRDFANWIYKILEAENDYINSDECADEGILANGYEFDATGNIA